MSEVIDNPVTVAVDDLFHVRAEIKRLTEIEERIKEVIMTAGHNRIEGTFVEAVVKQVQKAPTTDWKALVAYLKVSQDTLDVFSKASNPYITITLKPMVPK